MKCSVCAQDVPEDSYHEHLEAQHGVTDDPTAVLIQHLTSLRTADGDAETDEDTGLPDDEPSDADADTFEELLSREAFPRADAPAEGEEPEEAEGAEAEGAQAEDAGDEGAQAEDAEPEAGDAADAAEDTGQEGATATDKEESEFERMLAAQPEVDLRQPAPPKADAAEGAAATGAAVAGDKVDEAATDEAATDKAATDKAATDKEATDKDAETFAAWDAARQGRGADDVVVAPSPDVEGARRRRRAALLGLGAALILLAVALVYLATRNTGTKSKTAVVAPPVTTTVASTFLPGPPAGQPTTVVPPAPTTVPATTPTTVATATPATPATTAPPDPKTRMAFTFTSATCSNGALQVFGSVLNQNAATYTFDFTVQIVTPSNTVGGTGNAHIQSLQPNNRVGFTATGSCTTVNGGHPVQQITSITPG